jgi:acyl dehydratase
MAAAREVLSSGTKMADEKGNPMTAPATALGIEGLTSLVGTELGPTDWVEITQDMVDTFADVTGDHQWIHVDPERAQKEGPFGGPIAHGFLTLSLWPTFLPQLLAVEGFALGVNYGAEKVRFPAPVPVGGKLRAVVRIDSVTDIAGGVHVQVTGTFEIEGGSKPACVAVLVLRYYE